MKNKKKISTNCQQKIVLIFSPFSSLSYIPLGISYLKSFIKKNTPSVRVKNLDLSNNFYHNLENKNFSSFLSHLCLICPGNRKPKCGGILRKKEFTYWIKAALVSKSCIIDSKTDEFYNVDKYNKLRKIYDSFYGQIIFCIGRVLKYSLEFTRKENKITLENNLFKDDINKILSECPEIVGFSIFSESQLNYSLALAKTLKAKMNVRIVFGGAYISHLDKKAILQIFDFIDFIIYKEGELGLVSLLRNIKKGRLNQVPNLVYRKRGKIVENEESAVRNLDNIPFPDFSDYNLKKYFAPQAVLSTLFSRGCFWGGCTFCAHRKTYSNPYRTRSIPNLIQEFKHYQKRGIKHIWFADEIISAADVDWISKAILKRKLNICYGVMLKPTGDFTQAILKTMYRAGCRVIIWGVESFNQRMLNLMNKGTNAREIKKVLSNSHKIGLSNVVYMIRGYPMQTEEEILKDIEILRKKSRYFYKVGFHNFWLEDGTDIFRNPKKFELKYLKRNYLLKIKKLKLFSSNFSFINKKKIDWERINKLLMRNQKKDKWLNEFNDSGIFYNKEHILLHLSRNDF